MARLAGCNPVAIELWGFDSLSPDHFERNTMDEEQCPKCGSEKLLYSTIEDNGNDLVHYHCVCQDCDYSGYLTYELKFVGWSDVI